MLAPLSWLKDYVDIDVTPKELEEKLFSCGFEVEELIEVGKDVSGVVVGLVETCEPIPDTHLSRAWIKRRFISGRRIQRITCVTGRCQSWSRRKTDPWNG